MKVGVTGAAGFLGWHVRCRLRLSGIDTLTADRATFADPALLDAFVQQSDVILHLAGVNRANTDEEVAAGNRDLATALVAAMQRSDAARPTIYSNSSKSEAGGNYGDAKQAAADTLNDFLEPLGVPFVDLVLPHLFGEYGVPFYNSAVTTFAHQLARGGEADVFREGQLELVHAQDVAGKILGLIEDMSPGRRRLQGQAITVGETWDVLSAQHQRYVEESTIPFFNDRFELQLFNALRSQLFSAGHYPVPIVRHEDSRGAFSELCRADGLGQTSISTTVPEVTRGDHYHLDKIERFVVVSGRARIRLRRLLTNEIVQFDVDGRQPAIIDMPPLTTHNITNTGDDVMTTLFWAGDHFDPATPDTYPEPVEEHA